MGLHHSSCTFLACLIYCLINILSFTTPNVIVTYTRSPNNRTTHNHHTTDNTNTKQPQNLACAGFVSSSLTQMLDMGRMRFISIILFDKIFLFFLNKHILLFILRCFWKLKYTYLLRIYSLK